MDSGTFILFYYSQTREVMNFQWNRNYVWIEKKNPEESGTVAFMAAILLTTCAVWQRIQIHVDLQISWQSSILIRATHADKVIKENSLMDAPMLIYQKSPRHYNRQRIT